MQGEWQRILDDPQFVLARSVEAGLLAVGLRDVTVRIQTLDDHGYQILIDTPAATLTYTTYDTVTSQIEADPRAFGMKVKADLEKAGVI